MLRSRSALRRIGSFGAASCLLVALLGLFPAPPARAADSQQMQMDLTRLKAYQTKIALLQQQKKANEAQRQKSLSTIANIQQDLEQASRELEASSRRYETAQKDVEALTRQLTAAQGNWKDTLAQGQTRLRRMYMFHQYTQTNKLLESRNLALLMRRVGYFRYLAKHDEATLNDIKLQKEKLSRLQYQQMLKRQELGKQAHEQAEAKQKFASQKQREVTYLNRLNQDKAAYEREENALEADSKAIVDRLQSLFQLQRGDNSFNFSWTTGDHMIMPVRGVMTSPYGWRVHPIFGTRRLHTGQDWGVDSGTPVHAANSGVVIESGWVGGYGKCIMIDHGKGLVTLYGHNSELYVRAGQRVMQGQVISASGSTGNSTGPHLHLEVRRNGEPIDPLPFFK